MTEAVLAVNGLSSGYGQATVIRNLDLKIAHGEIVAVVGKNGMGKSTLLKSIMGYLPKFSGSVSMAQHAISESRPHQIARLGVAYVPQEKALFQDLTVEENIRLALRGSVSWNEAEATIRRCFPFLLKRLQQKAGTLSGGEQKMLLIARSLSVGAKVLLIDEITEGMQPSVITNLVEIIKRERDRSGLGVLLVEQNIPFTRAVSDRYVLLDKGEISGFGNTRDPDTHDKIAAHISL
ncbi:MULTISPECIES: ABC transporter ATP-binding protein [Aminobacter]|uniref:ABC transporter ATP-binding protein n=1 Tax=Aminobacter TaxID=31988 RepID=UPI0006FED9F1|nr:MULTISPECIES: ABC transporter ATP-binding protein [Aminobacter]AWC22475.1 LIV-I protein F [Aminobacter sp. MSH1]KQU64996.1 ABC transporter ATP-binding protein [Aminobacter sp. DSM 101952]MDR7225153.1 branched-chain amino acid transport system ATP-binding protein [Aminobacter aminovorans]WMC96071.1 ABC transporter ATP-binding protein [Aminobacter aminovorans]